MWALSLPVRRHWSMNMPWLRFITWPVTTIVIGTVTRATSASCHEIENISTTHEHHRQQRGEQLAHRLLQGLADVVDVVGDPAEQLAARLLVEVAQRQRVDLVLDVGAHPHDGALDDVVEQVALEPAEQRRRDVHAEHEQQHVADRGEVDALPDHEVLHRGDHRGLLVVAAAAGGRRRPAAGWCRRAPCPRAVARAARRRSGRWRGPGSAGRATSGRRWPRRARPRRSPCASPAPSGGPAAWRWA